MNSKNFQFLAALLKQECGLALDTDKVYLAETRLGPIARQFNHADVDALVANIVATKSRESVRAVIEAMVTNETFFFRDSIPFQHFEEVALPELLEARKERRQLRIWSAAASTGQEPYSLAMILDRQRPKMSGWRTSILATDISEKALQRAKSGDYSQFEVQRGLPIKLLLQHFEPRGERWQIKQPIRQAVKFERFNLMNEPGDLGRFDVIFCRNVLMYFDSGMRRRVLARLARQLASDGRLYLGGAESIAGVSDAFTADPTGRQVYRLADAAQQEALAS